MLNILTNEDNEVIILILRYLYLPKIIYIFAELIYSKQQ